MVIEVAINAGIQPVFAFYTYFTAYDTISDVWNSYS